MTFCGLHLQIDLSSIITTTGFATLDYSTWRQAAIAVIFIAMFLGGNAGSTAGGVKPIRYIFKNLKKQPKK
ncbi:MAG: potassium transporter TrkG [Nautiliaceae bacterium]